MAIRQEQNEPTLSSATIDDLEQTMVVSAILRRYHLVQLKQHRQKVYELLGIQNASEAEVSQRATSDALNAMVILAYPH